MTNLEFIASDVYPLVKYAAPETPQPNKAVAPETPKPNTAAPAQPAAPAAPAAPAPTSGTSGQPVGYVPNNLPEDPNAEYPKPKYSIVDNVVTPFWEKSIKPHLMDSNGNLTMLSQIGMIGLPLLFGLIGGGGRGLVNGLSTGVGALGGYQGMKYLMQNNKWVQENLPKEWQPYAPWVGMIGGGLLSNLLSRALTKSASGRTALEKQAAIYEARLLQSVNS